ncbi:MAG: EpsG family protein [Clostridia bacterium]|nr:EpsG family protein [Clostridia bacterium]
MLVYVAVALFPFLIGEMYKSDLKKNEKYVRAKRWIYILLAALPMFVLIGFRNQNLGADTGVYLRHFSQIRKTSWSNLFDDTRMEYGYLIFVKIVGIFTKSQLMFQVICATIYLIGILGFCNQLENSPFLFLFFFCTLGTFTFMFTGIRQCLAMSICLLSYRYVKRKKFWKFLFCVALAFFFHKSSILFVAVYIIYRRKFNLANLILYGIICIVSILFLDRIQEWLNSALDYDYEIESTGSGIVYFLFLTLLTAFSVFLIIINKKMTKEAQGLINVSIITVFFWALRLFTRVAERPSYYFLFFSFAMFVYAIQSIKDARERDIVKIFLILLCMALYIYRFMGNFASLVPYSFFS